MIRISHPVPVRHQPRGSRGERLDFVRGETAARIQDLPMSEFRHILGAPWLYVRGREFWQAVSQSPDGKAAIPVTHGAFRDWISGRRDGPANDIDAHFRRTPLVAATATVGAGGTMGYGIQRGTIERGDLHSRVVAMDASDRAAAAVAQFMESDVADVDGMIMTRVSPLFGVGAAIPLHPRLHVRRGWKEDDDILFTPERLCARYREDDRWPNGSELVRALASAPSTPREGCLDEHAHYAHRLPGRVCEAAEQMHRRGRTLPEGIQALTARLRPIADIASVGALTPDELAPALELSEQAMRVLGRALSPKAMVAWHNLLNHLSEGVLAPGQAIGEDDAEALVALAP